MLDASCSPKDKTTSVESKTNPSVDNSNNGFEMMGPPEIQIKTTSVESKTNPSVDNSNNGFEMMGPPEIQIKKHETPFLNLVR